jgi:hypothetical protein
MSNAETEFRLEVARLAASDTQWAFYIFDQDDRNWTGEPKETYATRREALKAGTAELDRLIRKPSERLALRLKQAKRWAQQEGLAARD